MAINVASKYSSKVVERFKKKSLTDKGLNNDYEWSGVKTVSVYSIPTSPLVDYTRSGTSRYGSPVEVQDTKQDMTLSKDRSFSLTIDAGNEGETMNTKKAGQVLARQNDEVLTPELDTYRLSVWASKAGISTTGAAAAVTKDNAYGLLLTAQEKLDEALVPEEGRILYCTPAFINLIKQAQGFVLASDIAQNKLIKNQFGEIDGVAVVKVPTTRMPAKTPFLLIHPSCSCSPMKLKDCKIHTNPPGINGTLIEGRYIYDCFVFDTLVGAICKHMIP